MYACQARQACVGFTIIADCTTAPLPNLHPSRTCCQLQSLPVESSTQGKQEYFTPAGGMHIRLSAAGTGRSTLSATAVGSSGEVNLQRSEIAALSRSSTMTNCEMNVFFNGCGPLPTPEDASSASCAAVGGFAVGCVTRAQEPGNQPINGTDVPKDESRSPNESADPACTSGVPTVVLIASLVGAVLGTAFVTAVMVYCVMRDEKRAALVKQSVSDLEKRLPLPHVPQVNPLHLGQTVRESTRRVSTRMSQQVSQRVSHAGEGTRRVGSRLGGLFGRKPQAEHSPAGAPPEMKRNTSFNFHREEEPSEGTTAEAADVVTSTTFSSACKLRGCKMDDDDASAASAYRATAYVSPKLKGEYAAMITTSSSRPDRSVSGESAAARLSSLAETSMEMSMRTRGRQASGQL